VFWTDAKQPMPNVRRGEVWQVDFGLAAKVRSAPVLGSDIADEDRVLVALVYHTTALQCYTRESRIFGKIS
jgi:mRNA-degrading endonuclease toxin of MazEF toxin-antitoxin module